MTVGFTGWPEGQHLYEFSVEDSTLCPQVWKGEMGLNRFAAPLHEYACHEGSNSFHGIFTVARHQVLDGRTVQGNVKVE